MCTRIQLCCLLDLRTSASRAVIKPISAASATQPMAFFHSSQGGLKRHLSLCGLSGPCFILSAVHFEPCPRSPLSISAPVLSSVCSSTALQDHAASIQALWQVIWGSSNAFDYIKPVAVNFYVCVFYAHPGVFLWRVPPRVADWESLMHMLY